MLTRRELEKREYMIFAPYAVKSKETKGRVFKEPEHPYRSVYQRDKDRIIYSTAFRRLEYKTQVFVNHEGDYYRTRLTHTIEVTQIAKSIARALRLNDELVEAIALAHDLGHTPFGHAGEDALAEIMQDKGGFDHNAQGLRVVEMLEKRYADFQGLNLTFEVKEGIVKHSSPFDKPRLAVPFEAEGPPSLETQVVDIADEIAYDNHDLDDGLASGLIDEAELNNIQLWKEVSNAIKRNYPHISDEVRKCQVIKTLIDMQVTDVIINTEKRIKQFDVNDPQGVGKVTEKIVKFSKNMELKRAPLRGFLMNNLYRHYRVVRMSDKAHRFIKSLFKVYLDKPEQLPPSTASRLKNEDKHRVICDYIAGMTDRYALDEYKKFFEPYERV